jgi:hypothetical protein
MIFIAGLLEHVDSVDLKVISCGDNVIAESLNQIFDGNLRFHRLRLSSATRRRRRGQPWVALRDRYVTVR